MLDKDFYVILSLIETIEKIIRFSENYRTVAKF